MKDSAVGNGKCGWSLGDFLLLFLALVLFFGALGYHLYAKKEQTEAMEVICVFRISQMERDDWEQYGKDWIFRGAPLRSENGTVVLGYVEEIAEKPCLRAMVRDGEAIWEAHPFLKDLEITVRMQASLKEGDGVRVGDLRMAAGGRGCFRFGGLLRSAELVEIREVEA